MKLMRFSCIMHREIGPVHLGCLGIDSLSNFRLFFFFLINEETSSFICSISFHLRGVLHFVLFVYFMSKDER